MVGVDRVKAVAHGHGWENLKGRTVQVLSNPDAKAGLRV